eukprot:COSAG03_NODE_15776_length_420_cov_3.087227_1_plen_20_part_10
MEKAASGERVRPDAHTHTHT